MKDKTQDAPGSAGQNGAHTKGPWVVGERGQIWSSTGLVAACGARNWDAPTPDVLANARLIAAAPDVVREASRVMALLAEHGPSIVPHLLDSDDNAGQRLRTAIAAATGEEG